jgi:hypothetical protein
MTTLPTTADRLVTAALLAAAGTTLWQALLPGGLPVTPDAARLLLLQAAVAGALVWGAFSPAVRLPALAAGALSAVAGLAAGSWASGPQAAWLDALRLALLVAAGARVVADARREARWDGVLPSRQEG